MKPSQRMSTNQTTTSNKRSSNNKSKNNKSYDNMNNNSHSFQLPKIHRSSNIDTTSNRSYDMQYQSSQKQHYTNNQKLSDIQESQKQQTILLAGVVNYEKMTMEQIKHQYQRLRKQFNMLTMEIKSRQQIQLSRVSKKSRAVSTMQTQKTLAKTQQQVYENSLLLQKLRLQYQQIDKRSNLANSSISRPNAELNQKLIKLKQKILTTKDKIKLLRKKTKKSGQDILNGQDVHQLLQKLQRQSKNYQSKLANLQAKLQESKFKIQRQDEKMQQIQKAYIDAQDYMKLFKLQNQQQQQRTIVQKQYRQLKHKQQIIKKKIQSDQQTFIQKYHQLLKLLQTQTEKQQLMNKRLIQEDIKILKARNGVLEYERELESLEEIMGRFRQQQEMKKQAQILRKAIQGVNANNEELSSFITQGNSNKIGSIRNNNNNKNFQRVTNSIMQENESQLYDTIEGNNNNNNNNSQINENQSNSNNNINQTTIQNNNSNNSIRNNDNISIEPKSIQRYHIPTAKDIVKKRQQQKHVAVMSQMKKQSSNNDVKTGRKVYSLMKAREIDSSSTLKLKQNGVDKNGHNNRSMNMINNSNNNIRMPSIHQHQKRQQLNQQITKTSNKILPSTTNTNTINDNNKINQPYINYSNNKNTTNNNNKSNNHQKQIQRNKQVLRQRKNNMKGQIDIDNNINKNNDNLGLDRVKQNIGNRYNDNSNNEQQLQQLQRLNRQLLMDDSQQGDKGKYVDIQNEVKVSTTINEQKASSSRSRVFDRAQQQSNRSLSRNNNNNNNINNNNSNNNYKSINSNSIQQQQYKQSKIKKQQQQHYNSSSKIKKPQVFDKIDKTNVQYNMRIQQLKKQIKITNVNNSNDSNNSNNNTNNNNNNNSKNKSKQTYKQQQQHQPQQQQQQQQQIIDESIDKGQNNNNKNNKNQQDIVEDDIDDDNDNDIDDDIKEINQMIKKKRIQHQEYK